MRIREVAITTHDLDASAASTETSCRCPSTSKPTGSRSPSAPAGWSSRTGSDSTRPPPGLGITPYDFPLARTFARTWLSQRVTPMVAGDSGVIDGPASWNSQSVYLLGPEHILREFITRQADAGVPGTDGPTPRPLSISEGAIGVPDAEAAGRELTETLSGATSLPFAGAHFAPVGNHDGLLIVVDQERIWFPTRTGARRAWAAQRAHPGTSPGRRRPHRPGDHYRHRVIKPRRTLAPRR